MKPVLICPNCKKKITELTIEGRLVYEIIFLKDKNIKLEYQGVDTDNDDFTCPDCGYDFYDVDFEFL